jgi:hypothetical protein
VNVSLLSEETLNDPDSPFHETVYAKSLKNEKTLRTLGRDRFKRCSMTRFPKPYFWRRISAETSSRLIIRPGSNLQTDQKYETNVEENYFQIQKGEAIHL